MMRGKPSVVGRHRVSMRVLMAREDYDALRKIADIERTDISSLVRRAIARYFFAPAENNNVASQPKE
jgi:hypothetical protein